ncbi:MAG TPA: (Fe-S)-binding protein [Mycobacteriales bacterium]|nr:(Fe-S)-binding protein [Mycobacteriales bacterium]
MTPSATEAPQRRGVFTPELLARCISCGFCLPACPTYALSRDEKSSPRGRITLMRALETGRLGPDDPTLLEESSYCLGCRACEPVCPAGVRYGALLEEWRDALWRGRRRPLLARLLMVAVDRPWRIRALAALRRYARTPRGRDAAGPQLMLGCFERVLYPAVSRAARAVDPALESPPDQGCCGALHAHNGELARGRALAEELGRRLPGVIVTTAGGCAAHLAGVLGRDRVVEISEHVLRSGALWLRPLTVDGRRVRVTFQDSCHLRNGLIVYTEPRTLLQPIADVVEVPSAAQCCGAAGSYSLLRPRDSRAVLAPHLEDIAAAEVDYVVTLNPGCYRQLAGGVRRRWRGRDRARRPRVVHIVELLARAAVPPGTPGAGPAGAARPAGAAPEAPGGAPAEVDAGAPV